MRAHELITYNILQPIIPIIANVCLAYSMAGGGRITSLSIRLPHNSLLVCWEGFQEFWRHEVPKDKGLKPHSLSGPARLNFTFRKSATGIFDLFFLL